MTKKFFKVTKRMFCMALTLTVSCLFLGVSAAADNFYDKPLAHLTEILKQFNEQYGTNYQIVSEESLKSSGQNPEEAYSELIQMSDEGFWQYVYDAHVNALLADGAKAKDIPENKMPDLSDIPSPDVFSLPDRRVMSRTQKC